VNVSAARAAKATGAIVCLNAAPVRTMPSELASLVDVLVVNAVEAEDMCGIAVDDLPSALAAARRLSSGFGTVVVTAGGAGVAGLERGAEPSALPALPVSLVSTHGAGDVFVGALAASMVRNGDAPLLVHLQAANMAAAEHVSSPRER
jgi:ribokinase